MIEKYICIRCPQGCEITTTLDGYGNIKEIKGNSCKLGIEHVKTESTDPRRVLTTSVKVKNGVLPLCPVWTEKPVPKKMILQAAEEIHKISVNAPVKADQIIEENLFGLGIRVLASRDIDAI